jgi:hypothetical protein
MLRAAGFVLMGALAAPVCNIPVFRYALERWRADPYEVLVFHQTPLSDAERAIVDGIRGAQGNLDVERVDLSAQADAAKRKIWEAQDRPGLPWVAVLYPRSDPSHPPAWSGPLDSATLRKLVDSPARQEMSKRILSGESAVWLLLQCGDRAKDDAMAAQLREGLDRMEKSLKLPPPDPEDPPLRSEIPLKIAFSVLPVSPADPAESVFVAMLRQSDPDLLNAAQPVAIPVFGRGRALFAIRAADLAQGVVESCRFITGACSCEAKEFNPGIDLLVSTDWDDRIQAPPLQKPELPKPVIGPGSAHEAVPAAPQAPDGGTPWLKWVLVGAGVLALLLVVAAVVAGLKWV